MADQSDKMVADLTRLMDALAAAYKTYSAEDGESQGQFHAIAAVLTFLQDANVAPYLQEPFVKTLSDLDHLIMGGKTDPKRAHELAWANATVTILIEAGHSRSEAIAKTVHAFGKGLTAKQMENYRDNFQGGKVPAEARTFYHQHLRWIHGYPKEDRVKIALDSLRSRRP